MHPIRRHLTALVLSLTYLGPATISAQETPTAPATDTDNRSTLVQRLLETPSVTTRNGCVVRVLTHHDQTAGDAPINEDLTVEYEDCAPQGIRDPSDTLAFTGIITGLTEAILFAAADYGADGPSKYDTLVWSTIDLKTGDLGITSHTNGDDPLGFVPAATRKLIDQSHR